MMVTRNGGDFNEDGEDVDSGTGTDQGTVGWLAGTGDHGEWVYSAFVGGTFQTGSCNEPERTVSDGASRKKGSGLAGEEQFDRQDGMVCAALSRREGTAVRGF